MSLSEFMKELAHGITPAECRLLHACRLEAFGAEAYGKEAIFESFRRTPLAWQEQDDYIETPRQLAVFHNSHTGTASALIADLYRGYVGRLWRLGPGPTAAPERSVSVPFDPDLTQQHGEVFFCPSEHPELDPVAAAHVLNVARALARDRTAEAGLAARRTRCFVLRAFSSGEQSVALIGLYCLSGDPSRSVGFSYAAVNLRSSGEALIASGCTRDLAGQSVVYTGNWAPRV